MKDLCLRCLDKIITISWLMLLYSEQIENHWWYLLRQKSSNSDDNGYDDNYVTERYVLGAKS